MVSSRLRADVLPSVALSPLVDLLCQLSDLLGALREQLLVHVLQKVKCVKEVVLPEFASVAAEVS